MRQGAFESVPKTMGWDQGTGVRQKGTKGECGVVWLTPAGSCMGQKGYTLLFSTHVLRVPHRLES